MPTMTRKLTILVPLLAIAVLVVAMLNRRGDSQPSAPEKLVVGIYAPTVEFGTSAARLTYTQGLAKAIESNTGVRVEAQSFASLAALRKAGVDFAIVDAQCYASNLGWTLLANAQIGGGSSRAWGLFSSVGPEMQGLKGKKLAYVQTGCNDNGFIDNAMLESEVGASFFSNRVAKPDLGAAVAEVASYKGAQAVFAPVGSQKGLTKVFDTGSVANPAFVQLNGKLPSGVVQKVASAVVSYGGGGAITGWASARKDPFQSLAGRMGRVIKRGVFAPPEPVRFEAKDILVEPATLHESAQTEVKQHFRRPPERME